jgi:hypothetical protein
MEKKLLLITLALMLMLSAVMLITAYISNNPTALGCAIAATAITMAMFPIYFKEVDSE